MKCHSAFLFLVRTRPISSELHRMFVKWNVMFSSLPSLVFGSLSCEQHAITVGFAAVRLELIYNLRNRDSIVRSLFWLFTAGSSERTWHCFYFLAYHYFWHRQSKLSFESCRDRLWVCLEQYDSRLIVTNETSQCDIMNQNLRVYAPGTAALKSNNKLCPLTGTQERYYANRVDFWSHISLDGTSRSCLSRVQTVFSIILNMYHRKTTNVMYKSEVSRSKQSTR